MVFTATVIVLLGIFAIAAIIGGYWMDKAEIYMLGAALLLILGIVIANDGIAEKIGETQTEIVGVEETTTTITNVYGYNQGVRTNGIAALFMLAGAGAALTFWMQRRKQKAQMEEDVDNLGP